MPGSPGHLLRVRADGKFFRLGENKWFARGFTYGPFTPDVDGQHLPSRDRLADDFAHMQQLGATAIRVYHAPPPWLLDEALRHGLRVLIDVPWEKHRCFFEDWASQQAAREAVRSVARELGGHAAVFAISVANELPSDVVRFYGHRRIEKFLGELLDSVKQTAPECLACFGNFPTTEFVQPAGGDFCLFNVYLHGRESLVQYLERLQHLAGNRPLILGEYGLDSIREGEAEQAARLAMHVEQVFRCGLAGSFVFSYTDDWFTGGQQIEDWAFGVTRRDRSEKPAAGGLREVWRRNGSVSAAEDLPPVSVVVCSYNGAATLRECLDSLMRLNYPDYEVILVDDGSTDNTPEIAADFPQVICLRQANCGLSVARNVGARAARGEIIAYTDSDCVADEDWLLYLVRGLRDQQVDLIGGPNISPPSDSWLAKCVAASPGNPGHVMLDDRRAEHVPGCNLAVGRNKLLELGGFDPQFRQAGDDVDLCWRFLDEGLAIGYAPGAMVWHHRRSTVRAYLKQQKGYGRAEAMVQFKHPRRFGALGGSRWAGVIYGEGVPGLPGLKPRIYYGRFGSGLFQMIYRSNESSAWGWFTSLAWHAAAAYLLLLASLVPPLAGVAALMWTCTLASACRSAWAARLPSDEPFWCRPLIAAFHVLQPLVRGGHHCLYRFRNKRLPAAPGTEQSQDLPVKVITAGRGDLYWESNQGHGRGQLLERIVDEARQRNWKGEFDGSWSPWDVALVGDRWHSITLRTATEELGWPRRFTRARWSIEPTVLCRLSVAALSVWCTVALATGTRWAAWIGLAAALMMLAGLVTSRRRCSRRVAGLIACAAQAAGLQPVDWRRNGAADGAEQRAGGNNEETEAELSTARAPAWPAALRPAARRRKPPASRRPRT